MNSRELSQHLTGEGDENHYQDRWLLDDNRTHDFQLKKQQCYP